MTATASYRNQINLLRDFAEWRQQLERDIGSVLEGEVAAGVKDRVGEVIQRDVYDKYEPDMYARRGAQGGLADPDNYETELTDGGLTLEVHNLTKGNEEEFDDPGVREVYIDEVIESGIGYEWEDSRIAKAALPRPFHDDLVDAEESEGLLRDGLWKRKYRIYPGSVE